MIHRGLTLDVVTAIGAMAGQTLFIILGFYLFQRGREDKIMEKHSKDVEKLEKRIQKVDEENDAIVTNYRDRLDTIKEDISRILVVVARLETKMSNAA